MEARTECDTDQMSLIFVWIGVAILVGVPLIGPLFDRLNGLLLLTACFLMMTVLEVLSPTSTSVYAFQALVGAANAFIFCIETGQMQFRDVLMFMFLL